MFKPPAFFESKGVLLLGMGGGYDVFAGIPLFFELRERGVPAVLANLSFAFHLDQKMNPQQETVGSDRTICIRAHHGDHPGGAFAGEQFPANYYPEFQLSQWLQREHKLDVPVCQSSFPPCCSPFVTSRAQTLSICAASAVPSWASRTTPPQWPQLWQSTTLIQSW